MGSKINTAIFLMLTWPMLMDFSNRKYYEINIKLIIVAAILLLVWLVAPAWVEGFRSNDDAMITFYAFFYILFVVLITGMAWILLKIQQRFRSRASVIYGTLILYAILLSWLPISL